MNGWTIQTYYDTKNGKWAAIEYYTDKHFRLMTKLPTMVSR